MSIDDDELDRFEEDVVEVAVKRDLATATDYGIRLNRIISSFDRRAASMTEAQSSRLAEAHEHVHLMTNCPRRMRLDDTWPNDFVIEARRIIEKLRLTATNDPSAE